MWAWGKAGRMHPPKAAHPHQFSHAPAHLLMRTSSESLTHSAVVSWWPPVMAHTAPTASPRPTWEGRARRRCRGPAAAARRAWHVEVGLTDMVSHRMTCQATGLRGALHSHTNMHSFGTHSTPRTAADEAYGILVWYYITAAPTAPTSSSRCSCLASVTGCCVSCSSRSRPLITTYRHSAKSPAGWEPGPGPAGQLLQRFEARRVARRSVKGRQYKSSLQAGVPYTRTGHGPTALQWPEPLMAFTSHPSCTPARPHPGSTHPACTPRPPTPATFG